MLIIGRIFEESRISMDINRLHVLIGKQRISFKNIQKDVKILSIVIDAMDGKYHFVTSINLGTRVPSFTFSN